MDGQLLARSQHCSVYLVPQSRGQAVRKQLFGSLANFVKEVKFHLLLANATPASFPAVLSYDEARKEVLLEYCERQIGMSAFELVLKSLQAVKAMHDQFIIHGNLSSRSLLQTGTSLKLTGLKNACCVKGNKAVFMDDLVSLGKALSSMLEEQVPISVRLIVELLKVRLNLGTEILLDLLVRSNPPLASSHNEARANQVAEALISSCQDQSFPQERAMQLVEQYKEVIQANGLIYQVSLKQSGGTCYGCQGRLADSDLATLHCTHRLCRLCVKRQLPLNSCRCGQAFQEGEAPFGLMHVKRVSVKCPHCCGEIRVERKKEKHQCAFCACFFCTCCLKTKH